MALFDFFDDPPPRRRTSIKKALRNEVWNKYIGATKTEGPCYGCRRTIHIQDYEVGHNKARAQGGTDNLSNLRPICRPCNRAMGTMSIETYKKRLKGPATKKKPAKKKRRRTDDDWGWF